MVLVMASCTLQYSAIITHQFSHKYSQPTPHSSPIRVSYGMSLVDSASDWYSASVPAIIYAKSYCIGLYYNGTLY